VLLAPRSTAVVVVAGLPGAGKTTLVASEPRALDSDAVRVAWAPRLARLPYALWRPLVHAWHWIAIWRALAQPDGVIVVRPFTSGWLRRAVLRRARRHHAAVHLVVVDATPAEARAGQRERGRTIRERAMRRHERRWSGADFAREPWTTVTRLRARSAPDAVADVRGLGRRLALPAELGLGGGDLVVGQLCEVGVCDAADLAGDSQQRARVRAHAFDPDRERDLGVGGLQQVPVLVRGAVLLGPRRDELTVRQGHEPAA
jgi:hypothetical protein